MASRHVPDRPPLARPRPAEAAPPAAAPFEAAASYVQLKAQKAQLERLGIANPYFSSHDGVSGRTVSIDGRSYLNYSGYNYLGLSGHPEVSAAAKDAIDRYGTSVSASRIASGEIGLHRELEREIASMLGTGDSIVFVSGYGTNVGVIGHLMRPRDLVVHDALIHNSVRTGVALSGAHHRSFPHNDLDALERLLAERRERYRQALIVVEGVYSMDGDLCDLPRLIEIKRRHGAMLMIDEAHSIGVLGATGRGIGEHFGIDPSDVDIWMGTLSKALAASGGYISGAATLIDHLKYTTPGFIYSVGLSPADAAAALAALRIMRREPGRVARLRSRAALFLERAREAGLDTGTSGGSAVVPVMVGESLRCLRLAEALFQSGVSVQPILHPAVAEGAARLRFFITAEHEMDDIRATVDALAAALRELALADTTPVMPIKGVGA